MLDMDLDLIKKHMELNVMKIKGINLPPSPDTLNICFSMNNRKEK